MGGKRAQIVVWTDLETTRKLHVKRMQQGPAVGLCGCSPPVWLNGIPVVDPDEAECCKRCLVISKRRKKEWPRG